jgi:hypothetical protein
MGGAAEGAIDDVGEMHGPVAVRRYIQDWLDTFDDSSVVAEELRDVGDDRVLAIQRAKGRAKLSGVEIDLRYAVVYTLRAGEPSVSSCAGLDGRSLCFSVVV